MYDLPDYGAMLTHRARTDAYARAIARAVKPGDAVVEIGCGPGFFSLLACRAGARRVYAIESSDSVAFAQELVSANGCDGRVQVLHGLSRHVNLPERTNVIISDIRGTLPLLADALASIEDARERFLVPGGLMIPGVDRLYAALASAPDYYASLTSPWRDSGEGVRLSPLLKRVLNSAHTANFEAERLASEPVVWGEIDYRTSTRIRPSARLELRASRSGMAHGYCLWFETTLLEDIGYSSAPGQTDNIYGQLFLPWCEPVEIEVGQRVLVELHADPVEGDYIWRWDSRFPGADGAGERVFLQSTLEGARFMPETLRRRSAEFVPTLSERGAVESWVMQRMDGSRSVEEIAAEALSRFPSVMRSSQEAFHLVSRIADKFAL